MLFKLAYNNIIRSKSYFLAYAITISIFSILVYSTTVIQSNISEAISVFTASESYISEGLGFAQSMVYFVIFAFSFYIIRFFLNRRKKEVALYKLFGLSSYKIFQVFLIENAIIIAISFVLSMVFGMFISRFILMIAVNMLQLNITNFPLQMPFSALKAVFFSLSVIYIIMSIIPLRLLAKTDIKKLFDKDNNKQVKQKFPWFSFIAVLITGSLLIYFLFFVPAENNGSYFFAIFFLSIFVVFFMYRGFFYTIFYFIKKKNIHLKSPIALLTTNHFMSSINSLNIVLSFITVSTAIIASFITLVFGAVDMLNTAQAETSKEGTLSYVAFNDIGKQKITDIIETQGGVENYLDASLELSPLLYTDMNYNVESEKILDVHQSFAFISESDFLNYINNSSLDFSILEEKLSTLTNQNALVLTEQGLANSLSSFSLDSHYVGADYDFIEFFQTDIFYGNAEVYTKNNDLLIYKRFYQVVPVIITNQNYEKISKDINVTPYSLIINKNTFLEGEKYALLDFYYSISQKTLDDTSNDKFYIMQYFLIVQNTLSSFVYSSLQITFLIIIIAIVIALVMTLFFRTLEVVENVLEEYKIASIIGLSKEKIYTIILMESAFTQLLPFYAGILGGLLVFTIASKFIFNFEAQLYRGNTIFDAILMPSSRFFLIMLFVIIHVLYIGLNYNIKNKIDKRLE